MVSGNQINNSTEKIIGCFFPVECNGENAKNGITTEKVIPFIQEIEQYNKVRIVGLMTMAPHTDDENLLRKVFRKLATLRDEVKAKDFSHAPCTFLSMGMSNDYEIAIEEGATHIRIGSKLVGN